VLGSHDHKRRAEQGIRPGGKDGYRFVLAINGKLDLGADGFADPVLLRQFDAVGPV